MYGDCIHTHPHISRTKVKHIFVDDMPVTRSYYKNTLKKKKPYDKSDANKRTEEYEHVNVNDNDLMNIMNKIEYGDLLTPLKEDDLDTVLEMMDEIECDESQEYSIRDNTPKRSSKNGDGTVLKTSDSLPPQSIPVQKKNPFN